MTDLTRIKDQIDTRLNDCLCEMKPGYDDSVVGFNEAWDIVRKVIDGHLTETKPPPPSDKIKYWWSADRQWFCILVNDGTCKATVSLTVEEAEKLMDEVMQTPRFLAFQKECADRAIQMVEEAAAKARRADT